MKKEGTPELRLKEAHQNEKHQREGRCDLSSISKYSWYSHLIKESTPIEMLKTISDHLQKKMNIQ